MRGHFYTPRLLIVPAALLMALAVLMLSASPAHAAPVACNVNALRDAIGAANTAGQGILDLSPGCTYLLLAPDGDGSVNGLTITGDITINGNNAKIRRYPSAPDFRILLVDGTGELTLNNTIISGGSAIDCAPYPWVCGGGIHNLGTMTVNNSKITNNTATADIFAEGGGIDSDGTATLNNTEVSGNTAEYTGLDLGEGAAGGGIANDGPLTLNNSRVFNNSVGVTVDTQSEAFGAGLAAFAPTTIKYSVISDNHANAPGGTASGALTISESTTTVTGTVIRDNTATAFDGLVIGAGVNVGFYSNATLFMSSSQISGNLATAEGGTALGGGLFNDAGSTTTLNQSVVTGNRAGDGGGIYEADGTVTLNSSTVFGNIPNNCRPLGSVPGCSG